MTLRAAVEELLKFAPPDPENGYKYYIDDPEQRLADAGFRNVVSLVETLVRRKALFVSERNGRPSYRVDYNFTCGQHEGRQFAPPGAHSREKAAKAPDQTEPPADDKYAWSDDVPAGNIAEVRTALPACWPDGRDSGRPKFQKRIAFFGDADNLIIGLSRLGEKLDPFLLMDRLKREGDVVIAEFFVDSSTIPDLRGDFHLAGFEIRDCPKFREGGSKATKDTVDDAIVRRLHQVAAGRTADVDEVILASQDKNFALAIADVRRPGMTLDDGTFIRPRTVRLLLATPQECPRLLNCCDSSMVYMEAPKSDLARASALIQKSGVFETEDMTVQLHIDALADVVQCLVDEIGVNTVGFGFYSLLTKLRTSDMNQKNGFRRHELQLYVNVLQEIGALRQESKKEEGKASVFRAVSDHPFVAYVLGHGESKKAAQEAAA